MANGAARESQWVVSVQTAFPDIGASIAAQRFCRQGVVTASTEPIDFRNPIHVGEIIELKCRVAWTGRTSMIVRCEVHGENPLTGERRLCTIGHLNFVAIGPDGRPTQVPALSVSTELERRHWETGARVREDSERRRDRKADQPTAGS